MANEKDKVQSASELIEKTNKMRQVIGTFGTSTLRDSLQFAEPSWMIDLRDKLESLRPVALTVELAKAMERIRPITAAVEAAQSFAPPSWVNEMKELQEFHSSLLVSHGLADSFSLPVIRLFHENNWFSSINAAEQMLTNRMPKSSRLITEYLSQRQEVVNVGYDFSKVDDKEDVNTGLIITPTQIIHEAKSIADTIVDIYRDNKFLLKIPPRKFEEVIAELLMQKGYVVDLTKQTRDGGYDILALSYDNGMPLKYLVECKRYARNRPIGINIVRSFFDTIRTQEANKGIIFTTSSFTADAWKRQKANPYFLDYKDHDDIITWVREYMLSR